jgi:hypothetical protein
VAFGFDLLGQFVRNGFTQTLEMRWKDRFKYEKKLADQFVVIVDAAEQLRYFEDRRRSDIHFIAPSSEYLEHKPADADKNNGMGQNDR